jgi:hypothetical protein
MVLRFWRRINTHVKTNERVFQEGEFSENGNYQSIQIPALLSQQIVPLETYMCMNKLLGFKKGVNRGNNKMSILS